MAAALSAAASVVALPARAADVLVSDKTFFQLPEGISLAPGGGYLVSEADKDTIVPISTSGAVNMNSIDPTGFRVFGETQLGSFYGSNAGTNVAFGVQGSNGVVASVGTSGLATPNITVSAPGAWYLSPAVASTAYGAGKTAISPGQVVLSNQGTAQGQGSIELLNADLKGTTTFAKTSFSAFGLAFAPSGFGQYASDLFTTDFLSGNVYVVEPDGTVKLFDDLPLPTGFKQPGLRQIAFAPSGFGNYGGDLFVSVAAQNGGGGNNGYIEAIDGSGNLIAGYIYKSGGSGSPLDPRGLLFAPDGDLIVANADPGVNSLTPSDFIPAQQFLGVPEPGTMSLALTSLIALSRTRRRRAELRNSV